MRKRALLYYIITDGCDQAPTTRGGRGREFRREGAGGGEPRRRFRGGHGGEDEGDSKGCDVEWRPVVRSSASLKVVAPLLSKGVSGHYAPGYLDSRGGGSSTPPRGC
jgi:hypothetical protein